VKGTFARLITFAHLPKQQIVKRKPIPTGTPTDAQLSQRAKFTACKDDWHNLDPDTKQYWINKAKGYPQTAFSLFLATCLMAPPTIPTKIQDADADTIWNTELTADEDKIHGKVKGVEGFLLDDAGVLTLARQSALQAYLQAAQNINTGTWTIINIDTEVYDVQNEFSTATHKYTATKAGTYLIVGSCGYDASQVVANKLIALAIYKNNNEMNSSYIHSALASYVLFQVTAVITLAVNDYIDLRAYHDFGQTKAIRTGITATSLTIIKLT
jgi:hypothetical protein